jgi:hypothetical protein
VTHDSSFLTQVSLNEGPNAIEVRVVDPVGNDAPAL